MAATLAEYPLLIAGVFAALAVIGKATAWVYRTINAVVESSEYVRREMEFNGGSTLRDAVGRTERAVDKLANDFDSYVTQSSVDRADLRQRLEVIECNQGDTAA